jgi:predicted ATP-grasp superfamily ATP-dependent carboligase
MKTVLVTDGHLRSALATVRSLGRAGYRVVVCSPRAPSLAGSSRWSTLEVEVPDSLRRARAFAEAAAALGRREGASLLLPMSEESLTALAGGADLSGLKVPFPSLETMARINDKQTVLAAAAALGMSVPEQTVAPDRAGVSAVGASLPFPVVVKPARSVSGAGEERAKFGVTYAADPAELARRVEALPDAAFPLLLQRRIEGPGTGIFLLIWDAKVLARFAHRRIREKPASGGVSVCAESIAADPSLVDRSRELLVGLGWEGPAMVEFKEDATTGERYLMEINGRFWGSLQLAIDAGVDFPRLLAEAALGEHPRAVTDYRLGVRWRWWWGEVDHVWGRLRGDPDPLVSGGRIAAIKRLFLPGGGAREDVLRFDDARPFVRETLDWFRGR